MEHIYTITREKQHGYTKLESPWKQTVYYTHLHAENVQQIKINKGMHGKPVYNNAEETTRAQTNHTYNI